MIRESTKIKNNCLICNKEYLHKRSKKNSKYCSRLCANRANAWNQKVELSKINCVTCNKEFEFYHWDRLNAKYCSRQCKGIDSRRKPITDKQNLEIIKRKLQRSVIKKNNGCWIWQKGKISSGYGQITDGRGNRILTHRASYLIYNGPIEDNKYICHRCDTRNCISPQCLFLGDAVENHKDMMYKNRGRGFFEKGLISDNRRFNQDEIKIIRSELANKISSRNLAKKYNVDKSTILNIKNNITYKEII